jgi:hypothetical protein
MNELEELHRDRILALEQAALRLPRELQTTAADYVTRHHFAPGCYAREIELPADSIVIGKIHRHAHVNVVSKGHVVVYTPTGLEEIRAPATFISKPGTKRVVVALEDTVWTTIHVTNETDLEKIEAEIIAPSFGALGVDHVELVGNTRAADDLG